MSLCLSGFLSLSAQIIIQKKIPPPNIQEEPAQDEYIREMNFGFIPVGSSLGKYISIKYGSTYDSNKTYQITDIHLLGLAGNNFYLPPDITTPINVKYNSDYTFYVIFRPITLGEFVDSVIIMINHPGRPSERLSLCVRGYSQLHNEVWVSNTNGEIGRTDVRIPINTRTTEEVTGDYLYNYRLTLSIDANFFDPIDAVNARVVVDSIKGDKRILVLENIHSIAMTNVKAPLTYLRGEIFLSPNSSSTLKIENLSWDREWLDTRTVDGIITRNDFCVSELSVFKFMPLRPTIVLTPNPASDFLKINIESPENGMFSADIFSMDGRLINTCNWVQTAAGGKNTIHSEMIDMTSLHSGIYNLVLRTPYYKETRLIMVVK